MNSVTILLATYNGEHYLEAQLNSLFRQKDWSGKILARDDGSTDRTLEILGRYPDRIEILTSSQRLGVIGNFSALMEQCDSLYMMFCDQDDVWKEDKIQTTFAEMKRLESIHGSDTPLLVHTDLEVVNEQMIPLAESYWDYARLYPTKTKTLNRLLVQNVVTGCTVMINRSLAKMAAPIPPHVIMHDWWLALVASALGKIGTVEVSTMYYRQHKKNTLGAQKFGFRYLVNKFFNPVWRKTDLQAQHLIDSFSLSLEKRHLVQRYLAVKQGSSWKARYLIFKYRFWGQGFFRNLASFLIPSR